MTLKAVRLPKNGKRKIRNVHLLLSGCQLTTLANSQKRFSTSYRPCIQTAPLIQVNAWWANLAHKPSCTRWCCAGPTDSATTASPSKAMTEAGRHVLDDTVVLWIGNTRASNLSSFYISLLQTRFLHFSSQTDNANDCFYYTTIKAQVTQVVTFRKNGYIQ